MARTTTSWASPTASRCPTRWPRTARYYPHVPLFAGKRVYTSEGIKGDANRAVSDALDKARQAAGLRPHPAQLPAFLALQGAGDLPQRAAMVHRHGQADRRDRRHLREKALAAIDATRFVPRAGYNRLRCDDRAAARLVRLAPARLGRADRGVRQQGDGRAAARPRGDGPRRRGLPRRRRRRVVREPARALPRQQVQGRGLRAGEGHPRRLVRLGLHARLHPRGQSRAQMAGRPLSRGLRPASRLVPFLAARELRHARPRALRRRADARLHARRAGPQDVEVAGQHHRAANRVRPVRRRHPAPVGGRHRLHRGPAHRPGDPEAPVRGLSPAAQHAALPAGQPRRLRGGDGEGGLCRHARARALGAASPGRARRRASGKRWRISTST